MKALAYDILLVLLSNDIFYKILINNVNFELIIRKKYFYVAYLGHIQFNQKMFKRHWKERRFYFPLQKSQKKVFKQIKV